VAVLHTELHEQDVATRVRTDNRPWQPVAVDSPHSPFAVPEPSDALAVFAVEELASGELAGAALLWSIDSHNRSAHLGISILPGFRGRGLGTDVVRVLCEYGFALRNLRRLQVETLADNDAMIAAATRAGFRHEGTLRRAAWTYGQELDVVVYGLLSEEWVPRA
jgi:RimJ/RimL family protein N-acetyltransferase